MGGRSREWPEPKFIKGLSTSPRGLVANFTRVFLATEVHSGGGDRHVHSSNIREASGKPAAPSKTPH